LRTHVVLRPSMHTPRYTPQQSLLQVAIVVSEHLNTPL
jgi:hypothetical protein